MNFLLLVINIYITGDLPFPYRVNAEQKIVAGEAMAVSPAECFDYAIVRVQASKEHDLVLSDCAGQYKLFAVKQAGEIERQYALTDFLKIADQLLVIKKNQHRVISYYHEKQQATFLLGQKRAIRLPYAHTYGDSNRPARLLFVHKNNWFLYHDTASGGKKLSMLEMYFIPRNEEWARIWFRHLRNYWYKPAENIFLAAFNGRKRQFAMYDMQSKNWILAPTPIVSDEEKAIFKNKGANVLLKLGQPRARPEKHYYQILLNGKKLRSTRSHEAGEEVVEALKLKPKKNILKFVRFVAQNNVEKFQKDKNIRQLSPVSLDIDSNKLYLVVLRDGTLHDNKPQKLQILTFDKSLLLADSDE